MAIDELPIPGAVKTANRSMEMARLWIADGRQVVVFSPNLWSDAGNWGVCSSIWQGIFPGSTPKLGTQKKTSWHVFARCLMPSGITQRISKRVGFVWHGTPDASIDDSKKGRASAPFLLRLKWLRCRIYAHVAMNKLREVYERTHPAKVQRRSTPATAEHDTGRWSDGAAGSVTEVTDRPQLRALVASSNNPAFDESDRKIL